MALPKSHKLIDIVLIAVQGWCDSMFNVKEWASKQLYEEVEEDKENEYE